MTANAGNSKRPIELFLVEDNLEDVVLMQEVLRHSRFLIHLNVARDGEEALKRLHEHHGFSGKPLPDIILLDLKLPKKDGNEVLAEVKTDPELKQIPVLIMTSSREMVDRQSAYEHQANFYMVKPMNLNDYFETLKYIDNFWFKNIA